MTPIIYISDKFFYLFSFSKPFPTVDHELISHACSYAWALVPSFYLYSFIDTNKNYLQSQGVVFPPIIIHVFSVVVHLLICLVCESS